MIISFIGHSFVPDANAVKEKVKKLLNSIVDIEKITFYLGGHGSFDEICACVCRELKKEHKGKHFGKRSHHKDRKNKHDK